MSLWYLKTSWWIYCPLSSVPVVKRHDTHDEELLEEDDDELDEDEELLVEEADELEELDELDEPAVVVVVVLAASLNVRRKTSVSGLLFISLSPTETLT